MHRRAFLQLSCAAAVAGSGVQVAYSSGATENRLVFVLLRGGLDGLHAVVPYADPDYRRLRPKLAVPPPGAEKGALDLDGSFGLHPALAPLGKLYAHGELIVIPAAATRYRERSHFDGQNLLENGSGVPFGAKDGWLNRAIAALTDGERRLGLALGPTVPLLLRGTASVRTWAESPLPTVDEEFLQRLAYAYRGDPLFTRTLENTESSMSIPKASSMGSGPARSKKIRKAAEVAAHLLARDDGPRVAVMEFQGWDTHFAQTYRLSRLFEGLSAGIMAMKAGLGAHWRRTVVVVVSEFGRTAAENGSKGTDHGVGGVAFMMGGAVRGGRVVGSWPGLSTRALYEGRDVRPTTDYESLFKAVLVEHLGLSAAVVEDRILPNSRRSAPAEGLFLDA